MLIQAMGEVEIHDKNGAISSMKIEILGESVGEMVKSVGTQIEMVIRNLFYATAVEDIEKIEIVVKNLKITSLSEPAGIR